MLLLIVGGIALLARHPHLNASGEAVTVKVQTTTLSLEAQQGESLFQANCQVCHGVNAAGTKLGPPLIHNIYNPGHHSDESFYLAAAIGVRQHHWSYGDMPAQPQVSREQVTAIIRFIRELQEANGIVYEPHKI